MPFESNSLNLIAIVFLRAHDLGTRTGTPIPGLASLQAKLTIRVLRALSAMPVALTQSQSLVLALRTRNLVVDDKRRTDECPADRGVTICLVEALTHFELSSESLSKVMTKQVADLIDGDKLNGQR